MYNGRIDKRELEAGPDNSEDRSFIGGLIICG